MYPQHQTFFVLGLSKSGISATEFLLSKNAKVYIYDDLQSERIEKTAVALSERGAKWVQKEELGKMTEVCDALVLSPGIPIDHPISVSFKRNKKAVLGETELACRYIRFPVVAVTGTNGKTTTVSMLAEVLNAGGLNAKTCGNIGVPMLDICESEVGVAVAEISSFQLETLSSICPHIAVVLNITEDHLNRHYNMDNYIFLKAKLLKNMTETEFAVLNADDEIVRSFAEKTKARCVWFSLKERIKGGYLENNKLCFDGEEIISVDELPLSGAHNIQNALAVICVAKIFEVNSADIKKALKNFKGIAHRIERIAEIDGVEYIDDSKGTNVDATIKAVECMKRKTVLLLGGKNKGYDYLKLFEKIKNSKVVKAVLYGENRYALLKAAMENGYDAVTLCQDFSTAVRIAKMLARPNEAVLLSPASASFDEFTGYEERGEKFVEIVRSFAEEDIRKEPSNAQE